MRSQCRHRRVSVERGSVDHARQRPGSRTQPSVEESARVIKPTPGSSVSSSLVHGLPLGLRAAVKQTRKHWFSFRRSSACRCGEPALCRPSASGSRRGACSRRSSCTLAWISVKTRLPLSLPCESNEPTLDFDIFWVLIKVVSYHATPLAEVRQFGSQSGGGR